MNIVEKEANEFIEDFFEGPHLNSLANFKSLLTTKLYDFNRDRDKLDFLKILRSGTIFQKEEHLKTCNKPNCQFIPERDAALFAIDQEIDDINKFYTYQPDSVDKFTPEEESNLHSKLNDIVEKLDTLGLGQEIIYDEIESLKNHFDLGKKTWFQLLKGKVIDLTIEKALEETVVKDIYKTLTEGFADIAKQLK
ncbi:MAG: hypothetical protein JNL17_15940 [Cyclobacteriaceae bacterium]|nr:hypothetical protein [Cyclobacteriaceae bacterium]